MPANHQISFMSRRTVVLSLLAGGCSASNPNVGINPSPTQTFTSNALDRAANNARRSVGLGQLSPSPILAGMAERYAVVLSKAREFSHSVGRRSLTRDAIAAGYDFGRIAENIAWSNQQLNNTELSIQTVNNWLSSTGHRKNLLEPVFREVGSGITKSGDITFFVQIYGVQR